MPLVLGRTTDILLLVTVQCERLAQIELERAPIFAAWDLDAHLYLSSEVYLPRIPPEKQGFFCGAHSSYLLGRRSRRVLIYIYYCDLQNVSLTVTLLHGEAI